MTGTDLQIIRPKRAEIAGGDAERLPTLHTTARKDNELVAVWLKSHADSSHHTLRAYERIGHRFITAIEAAGSGLRHATIDDVQSALEVMRVKIDGTPASPATINTQVAAVKAPLGFAHQVGYTRFNGAWGAQNISERRKRHLDLMMELRETNSAVALAATTFSVFANMKEQHVLAGCTLAIKAIAIPTSRIAAPNARLSSLQNAIRLRLAARCLADWLAFDNRKNGNVV